VAVATLAIMTTQYCPASSIDGLIADSENSLRWLFQSSIRYLGPKAMRVCTVGSGAAAAGATTGQRLKDAETRLRRFQAAIAAGIDPAAVVDATIKRKPSAWRLRMN
jgi:hypothetical protein